MVVAEETTTTRTNNILHPSLSAIECNNGRLLPLLPTKEEGEEKETGTEQRRRHPPRFGLQPEEDNNGGDGTTVSQSSLTMNGPNFPFFSSLKFFYNVFISHLHFFLNNKPRV
jgi:hypothetical protein